MAENNLRAVWFNKDQQGLFNDLADRGLTSQSFMDFVKDAFHDKVDALRFNASKAIEQKAQEIVQQQTAETARSGAQ